MLNGLLPRLKDTLCLGEIFQVFLRSALGVCHPCVLYPVLQVKLCEKKEGKGKGSLVMPFPSELSMLIN